MLIRDGLAASRASSIERIIWSEGAVWTYADLWREVSGDVSLAGAGDVTLANPEDLETRQAAADTDDLIEGVDEADTAGGGLGDDEIDLGRGDDTYLFRRGDGRDLIDDSGTVAYLDTLAIRGYRPDQVTILRPYGDGDDMLLLFAGTDDEILLKGQFSSAAGRGLERIEFLDGTVRDRTHLVENISARGTQTDDEIEGFAGPEFLIGAAGNDRLSGGDGSNTYVFRRGDGFDLIEDNRNFDTDVVQVEGIGPAELILSRALGDPATLVIDFPGGADGLTLVNTLEGSFQDQIEELRFDTGAVWTIDIVRAIMLGAQQTPGDDAVIGFNVAEALDGGLGDDTLSGGGGSHTYIHRAGGGRDVIDDNGFFDTDVLRMVGIDARDEVAFRLGAHDRADLLLDFTPLHGQIVSPSLAVRIVGALCGSAADQIEAIRFKDGAEIAMVDVRAALAARQRTAGGDVMRGFSAEDVLQGGLGPDPLIGEDGSDSYVYVAGDGQDTIADGGFHDTDVLQIIGYDPADVSYAASPPDRADLIITFAGADDRIVVRATLTGVAGDHIERIDILPVAGAAATSLDLAALRTRLPSDAATAGDDLLRGCNGAETLDGGAGDDLLIGEGGSDTYRHAAGSGHDLIDDQGFFDTDVLELSGVAPSDVTVTRALFDEDSVVLTFAGQSGSLTIMGALGGGASQIEQVRFDDGTIWTPGDLSALALPSPAPVRTGTSGPDARAGTSADERLQGGDGDDVYTFVAGAIGDDLVEEAKFDGAADRIALDLRPADGGADRVLQVLRSGDDAILSIVARAGRGGWRKHPHHGGAGHDLPRRGGGRRGDGFRGDGHALQGGSARAVARRSTDAGR